ncbi:MAG: hypothetical protein EA398_10715 [Deltaproteobacteria bacterium]|nr:MAG: hypothetical protein EA398_10715 [Deltaproteobacteria bacterium]
MRSSTTGREHEQPLEPVDLRVGICSSSGVRLDRRPRTITMESRMPARRTSFPYSLPQASTALFLSVACAVWFGCGADPDTRSETAGALPSGEASSIRITEAEPSRASSRGESSLPDPDSASTDSRATDSRATDSRATDSRATTPEPTRSEPTPPPSSAAEVPSGTAEPTAAPPSSTDAFADCPTDCRSVCEALGHDEVEARAAGQETHCVVRTGALCGRTLGTRGRLLFPEVLAPCAEEEATCVLDATPAAAGLWTYVCRAPLACTRTYDCLGEDADLLAYACDGAVPRAIACAASLALPGEAGEPARCNGTRGACESPQGAWCDGDAFLCAAGLACDTSLVTDGPRSAGLCVDRSGPWQRCDNERECTGDTACLGILPEPGAHCAAFCQTASDCPRPRGVGTEPICTVADGARLCRLPCLTAADCPGELVCAEEVDGRFCL